MKAVFFIFVTTTLICCKKGGKDDNAPKNNLVNRWELRTSVGGLAGTINYQPDNGNTLDFKNDDSFAQYENGNKFQSGTYDLQATSEPDQYRITFHTNEREWSTNLILKGDTLVVLRFEPCCDIPDNTYVRITPLAL